MKEFFVELLGLAAKADTITTSQICWRTLVVFLIALVLLRVSGRHTFASNSAQETIVKFMLGALLSRAIAGDSPFGVILAAAVTLVLLHRVLAYATYFFPPFGRLVKGESSVLATNGEVNHHELRRASFSEEALHAALRGAANLDDLTEVREVRLEHDGTVTVVKKEKDS
ncbi:MAG: DUF421 domain-containing protein [Hymenobacter sp.]|nr:MAG: DUF421 domain-containing protein [Hymenobacter sp.]